ncbi:MAG: caspase family protein [Cyclobacteriaceae bacterium]|jgi:tetratricopeptide (TPR) repeat protein|nr:caspase family protein [Cytophagales bacterium]MCZ8329287.1 caspase family protein [Cyclobacteriaceae bacterium]
MKSFSVIILLFAFFSVQAQIELSPNKQYEAAVARFKDGDYKGCEEALAKFMGSPLRNKSYDAQANYYRGVSQYHLGNANMAISYLRTAIYGGVYERDNANLFLGLAFLANGNKDEAEKAFTAAIANERKAETVSEAYYQRGLVKEGRGSTDAAVVDFKAALDKNGQNQNAQSKYAQYANTGVAANRGKENESDKAKPTQVLTTQTVDKSLFEAYKEEKRYALVVGNSNYPKEIGVLKNPVNDAKDIAAELRKCNFEVDLLIDATHRQLEIAANNLFKKLSEGPKGQTVGLFFFAGHGLQFEGVNYLVPIDASITTPTDVVYACYPADKILGKMEFSNSRMNIVILDACRNNPFPATTRSGAGQGLAQVRAAKGAYVAFATAPGSVASDGSGRNGLYTQELLKAMRVPNLTIEQMFKQVRQNVSELSGGKQNTWDNSNIVGEFFFKIQ